MKMGTTGAWRHEGSGTFTSKSTYMAFFYGAISFLETSLEIMGPPKCMVFLCLAIQNKCWTVDWLAKWGLAHPEQCVLCDQEEMVQHILTSCVFARQL